MKDELPEKQFSDNDDLIAAVNKWPQITIEVKLAKSVLEPEVN